MPIYLYQNPKTKKVKEIVQTMSEKHTYSENGVEWKRVWTVPQATVDGKLDAFSCNGFYDKIDKTKNTMKDVWARSAELSDIRASKRDGVDPIKKQLFDNYEKKTKKPHPHKLKERAANASVVI